VLKATGRLQRAGPKCFDVLGQCAWTASESRAGAGALAGDGVLQLRREGDAQKGGERGAHRDGTKEGVVCGQALVGVDDWPRGNVA
jgi:hypothetical protein